MEDRTPLFLTRGSVVCPAATAASVRADPIRPVEPEIRILMGKPELAPWNESM
jgi:hypothetical protein